MSTAPIAGSRPRSAGPAGRVVLLVLLLLHPALAAAGGTPVREAGSPLPALLGEDLALGATTVSGLLGAPRSPFANGGWSAWFEALGRPATEAERAALARFAFDHPAVAAEVERLAGGVARARTLRDQAFAAATAEDLDRALSEAATGEGDPFAAIDLDALLEAARVAHAAVEAARRALPAAQAADRARLASPPLDPGADVDLVLRKLAGGATAVSRADPVEGVPPDLAHPLGRLLEAAGRDGGARLAATLAAEWPRLLRAGANASLAADAPNFHALLEAAVAARPPALEVDLAEALARLRREPDAPSAATRADASDLERLLGSDLAAAVGRLLRALAAHRDAATPDASERFAALLAADGPLTRDEAILLREGVAGIGARRERVLEASAGVVAEARALALVGAARVPATTLGAPGVLYNDGLIVILGADATHVTRDVLPFAPALLLDLGGDDVYEAPLAGLDLAGPTLRTPVDAAMLRSSVAIDLGGNDRYRAVEPFTLGAARGRPGAPALGLLVDAAGSDVYDGGELALAHGVDAVGMTIDLLGADRYQSSGPLGRARTTDVASFATGLLVDVSGNDTYRGSGFSALHDASPASATFAGLADLGGDDRYNGTCPAPPAACFGLPRPETASGARGVALFLDAAGVDAFPRANDPAPVAALSPGRERAVVVHLGPRVQTVGDGDGDLVPDGVDTSPDPDPATSDRDDDRVPDLIEALLGSDPNRPGDAVVATPLTPRDDGLLVHVPGRLAVGLAGAPSRFDRPALLTIDLGLDDADAYGNNTAVGGVSIDLGGNDRYEAGEHGVLAAGRGFLLDLAGDDAYLARDIAHASGASSYGVLLDAAGRDRYVVRNAAVATAGFAALLDLDGDDDHEARLQARAEASGRSAFIDLGGNDRYVIVVDTLAENEDLRQSSGPGVALFADLGGSDVYAVSAPNASRDASPARNNRVRTASQAIFIDVARPGEDGDGDGPLAGDVLEALAGTDAQDPSDRPVGGTGFVLRLPAAGLAVGDATPTLYEADVDYAMIVDLGGNDVYRNRAGGSTPTHPVAVALDLAGDDLYRYEGASPVGGRAPAGTSVAVAGTQGAGVLGVGLLHDAAGRDRFEATVNASRCAACVGARAVYGAAQGAGVLGIGVLVVAGDGAASFLVRLENDTVTAPPALARAHAQGAALGGVGLLERRGSAPDDYAIALGPGVRAPDAAASGQGYGAAGWGVLLDHGGENTLTAGRLAQGAGETHIAGAPASYESAVAALGPFSPGVTVGLLALAGAGADTLRAENESQGFARNGAVGVLFDADGDDVRVLVPREFSPGHGQAAALKGGVALLYDGSGRDLTRSAARGAPDRVQAYAREGMAILVDASGDDTYEAGTEAQAFVAVPAASNVATSATLVDRAGHDAYLLSPGGRGQASLSVLPGASGLGFAFFVDGAGLDRYRGDNPAWTNAVAASARPSSGREGWFWKQEASTALGRFAAFGLDAAATGQAADALASVLSPAISVRLDVGGATEGPLSGESLLEARIEGALAAMAPQLVDRVEFAIDGVRLADGVRSGSRWVAAWPTDARDGDGRRRFDDGAHGVTASAYPRARIAAGPASLPAAPDLEPWRAFRSVVVDNGPRAVAPVVPRALSSANGPVELALLVERDVEDHGCLRCGDEPLARPGPDEWIAMPRPAFVDPPAEACASSDCSTVPSGVSAAGAVHLTWAPPATRGETVVGYDVLRRNATGAFEIVGHVDARAPALRFRDGAPGASPATHRIDVVRITEHGLETTPGAAVATVVSATLPGPATGLASASAATRVRLAWNAGALAESYDLYRTRLDTLAREKIANVEATSHVDAPPTDVDLVYEVVALGQGGTASPVAAPTVPARASPGHRVNVSLVGAGATIPIAEEQLAQGWARVTWNLSGVPPGTYALSTNLTDLSGRSHRVLEPLLVDPVAPRTTIDLPPSLGAAAVNGSTLNVPFTVEDAGSGVTRTVVYARLAPAEAPGQGAWSRLALVEWAANGSAPLRATGNVTLAGARDGFALSVFAVSEDAAGNVEGLPPGVRPWPATENELRDGVSAALVAGRWTTRPIDLRAPSIVASPARHDVRPGTPVPFQVLAFDDGLGLASVTLAVGGDEIAMSPRGSGRHEAIWTADAEGVHVAVARAVDAAGNVREATAGIVAVDGSPPVIEEAWIEFGSGRVKGHAGERARLLARVADDVAEPAAIAVTADVSSVSRARAAVLVWDPVERVHRSEYFTVDRLAENASARVAVTAVDRMGHAASAVVAVSVDGTRVAATTPTVVERGPTWLVVEWITDVPARGAVEYGETIRLGDRTPIGVESRTHRVRVTGLEPERSLHLRTLSIGPGGIETLSDILETATGSGLDVSLVVGQAVSRGPFAVLANVSRHDGSDARAVIDVVARSPRGVERVLTRGAPNGAPVAVDLGDAWDGVHAVFARASDGRYRGESAAVAVVLDREAPVVRASRALVLAPGAWALVEVEERGSGFDLEAIDWTFDGARCAPLRLGDLLRCRVPPLAGEEARMELRVPDRAGNVATLDRRAPVERAGLAVVASSLANGAGGAALAPGGLARLEVALARDVSDGVVADLSALGGSDRTALARTGPGRYLLEHPVPASLPDAEVAIPYRVVDGEDVVEGIARARVDGTPPRIVLAEVHEARASAIGILLVTDEPTHALLRASGREARSSSPATHHWLDLEGLGAGREHVVALEVADEAGHAASATLRARTTPDTAPPSSVERLIATYLGAGRVGLRWDAATDDVGVVAYRLTTSSGPVLVNGTSTVATLSPGRHVVRVEAVDAAGLAGAPALVPVEVPREPRLAGGRVEPRLAGPGIYAFRIDASDAADADIVVLVDGAPHRMEREDPSCSSPCSYVARVSVGPETIASGSHRFSFLATGPDWTVGYPADGRALAGPVVVLGLSSPSTSTQSFAARPTPLGTEALVALAIGWILARPRRRDR